MLKNYFLQYFNNAQYPLHNEICNFSMLLLFEFPVNNTILLWSVFEKCRRKTIIQLGNKLKKFIEDVSSSRELLKRKMSFEQSQL